MLKNAMSLLIALLLIFPLGHTIAVSEGTKPKQLTNAEGFVYLINDDGTAEIVGYTGKEKKLLIPETVDGHCVTSLGKKAFLQAQFTEVIVADSIREIKNGAFDSCRSLTTVQLPEGLERLESRAFWLCTKLKTINLPDTLREIGEGVFYYCEGLATVQLSADHPLLELVDGVLYIRETKRLIWYPICKKNKNYTVPDETKAIGMFAFGWAKNLVSVRIPDSVTEISDGAFIGCRKLQEINIPALVTEVNGAFTECNNLRQIQVSPENQVFHSEKGVLFHNEDKKLVLYPAGRSERKYMIPEGTLEIGMEAFAYASSLAEVEIPSSVKKIGANAFIECSRLKTVQLPEGVEELGSGCFQNCHSLAEAYLPRSLIKVGSTPFHYCIKLSRVVLDEDHPALAIMGRALVCKEDMRLIWYPRTEKAKSLSIPEGVRIIDAFVFEDCLQFAEIILPEGVESIEAYAFAGCKNLKRIVLPASLTKIDKSAFSRRDFSPGLIPATYVVTSGSYAENFCKAYGLKIEAQ